MTYISKDTQDLIDQLEAKLQNTQVELNQSQQFLEKSTKARKGYMALSLVAFLMALVFAFLWWRSSKLVLPPKQNADVSAYLSEIDSLKNHIDMVMQQPIEGPEFDKGLWYFVQIGAYEKRNLGMYTDGMFNFRQQEANQLYKYTLGSFKDLNQALLFVEEVRALGLKDAFVFAQHNGERISIEKSKNL